MHAHAYLRGLVEIPGGSDRKSTHSISAHRREEAEFTAGVIKEQCIFLVITLID